MSGYLLDTNVPSELTRQAPDPRVRDWVNSTSRSNWFVSVITVGEIRKGLALQVEGARRRDLARWFRDEFEVWFEGRILPVSRTIAERWGEFDAARQRQGRPLQVADGLIAATAVEHNLTLVTRNVRDYDGLEAKIVNPWA